MPSWLVRMGGIAIAAALAQMVVFGSESAPSGSPLRGHVFLSALTGGVALAFGGPFLLVLVPYLAILFASVKNDNPSASSSGRQIVWGPPGSYLGVFALVFVVTIAGFPGAIATEIQQSQRVVDLAGAVIFLLWGLLVFPRFLPFPPGHHPLAVWRHGVSLGSAGLLGAATAAIFYHDLDPFYDSVFFLTANPVALSHAPFTVGLFTTGLGLTYLAAGGLVTALPSQTRWGRGILLAGRTLAATATAVIGLGILTQRFSVIRSLLF